MKADPAEDPQIPQKPSGDSELVESLTQKNAKLGKRVNKLRRTTVNLWGLADSYRAQLQRTLGEKARAINDLRKAEEHGELAEMIWQEERAGLLEDLEKAKEGLERIESANLAERLRSAEEQAEKAGQAWKAEKAELKEELKLAEERIVELETADMAEKLREAQESIMKEHTRAMSLWLALGKERREIQILREALETGEYPTGVGQHIGEDLP
ncbi:hypothetical protein EST38_g13208 [Candolleomyces aberdarensis]|uniref:Uncharacterized protein n=1 Tax=Candolleomyces aberdarensis TaxID=2316362 RepID=A0A4Q2D0I0_9AGAR|nr:hypothetical protein EST38_g13208 [Candolleomyces aberdarensis]